MCPIYSRLFFLPNWYKIKEMFLYSIKPLGIFHFILFYLILLCLFLHPTVCSNVCARQVVPNKIQKKISAIQKSYQRAA